MNPFYTPQQQNSVPGSTGPFNNNFINMINQFNQFKSTFQGDPKQCVQNMLDSGRMSQEQFNQLSAMAQFFKNFLH